ncbi:actin family [Chytridium lagenaria]|nr:actin family [Chytridium lagenaria]
MSSYNPKDSNFVVIEPGSLTIKAGWADYQSSPAAVKNRVGAKKREDAMEEDGKPSAAWEYLFGKELEEELAKPEESSQIDHIIRPIQEGKVVDWDAFEAIIKHIVIKELGVRRAMNECPTLIAVPIYWGNDDIDRLCQIMFEIINVPGLYIADSPLMAAFGSGVLSGVVVDIGHEITSVTPVVESMAVRNAMITLPFGGVDIAHHLKKLLNADHQLVKEYGGPVDDGLVNALRESDLCELKLTKDFVTPAALEVVKRVDYEFNGKKITVGPARLKAHEILFRPEEAGKTSIGIAEAIFNAVLGATDFLDKRLALWDNVILTGGVSAVKGLRERLENEILLYLAASETSNEFQAKEIKYVKIPEYFSAFRDRNSDAVYLGGTIVARLTLHSGGQHITKADYNELGPAAVRLKQ